ncbi:hypothetical protein RND81_14G021200 [Saponaria officinalis]|uniref:C3H1-type domain-containing protein n=1 Tax=Saponaria officinalis TaxID=3572 RepID=A0AAW1GTA3_SAPOF
MAETKPFKTKLCILYQRGRCERPTCTFAHGNSELRHFSPPFPERRGNRGDDLRNKLDRKRSPEIKYSPRRDLRGSHALRRFSPPTPHKRRKLRTHLDSDGQNGFQRTFRSPGRTPDRNKDKSLVALDYRNTLAEELKQVQYEIDVLLDEKCQSKIELEERAQEADSLSSKIRDLETQLSEEKDKYRRVNSKIMAFIRAHAHHSRLQHQIKRSQLQLDELVEELVIDATQVNDSEDHLNVNIISDDEIPDFKDRATPRKRLLPNSAEAPLGHKSGNIVRADGVNVEGFAKSSHSHLDSNRDAELDYKKEDRARPSRESKSRRRKDASKNHVSSDSAGLRLKGAESYHAGVPPTSMAANAVDDFAELTVADESPEGAEFRTSTQSAMAFPLPPPGTQNTYPQHEGDDENVNVDGV